MKKWLAACAAMLLAMSAIGALAQNSNAGDIRGTATDSSGAVIPDVTVTVTDLDKGVTKTYTTNSSGLYDTGSLVTGHYKVTFTKPGFQTFVRSSLSLDVQTVTIDAQMKPGEVSTEVVVNTDVPLIETETGEQSSTLEAKEMQKLPNQGQDWQNFVKLIPGSVATTTTGTSDTGQANAINGNLPYNAVLADGASSSLSHSGNADVSVFETVQEVKISTSAFSAQYGVGGAVFNQISKGGTNQFHGSLYEYAQNDAFNARSYFQTSKPYLRYHNFGGSVGGPVLHDKLFFYFNFDKTIQQSASTGYNTVPTAAMRNGDFSGLAPVYNPNTTVVVNSGGKTYIQRQQYANNQVPIDPVAAKIQALIPLPNYNGPQSSVSASTGVTTNNYYYNVRGKNPFTKYFGRFDYDVSKNNRITGSVTKRDNPAQVVGTLPCPINCELGDVDSYNSQITDVWNISSRTINEARFGYTNQLNFYVPQSQGTGLGTGLGMPYLKADILPTINFGLSGSTIYQQISPSTAATYKEHNYDPSDVVTMIRGSHVLHFGGEYLIFQDNSTAWGNVNGATLTFSGQYTQCTYCQTPAGGNQAATGSTYADFLVGTIQDWNAKVTPEFAGRQKAPQMFVQDDWKIKPNFTLNVGLRYQIMEGWSDNKGNQRTFDPNVTNAATGKLGAMWYGTTKANGRTQLQNNVYDTFLPRVGFAWTYRPGSVLRGGYGLYAYLWSLDTYGGDEGSLFGSQGSLTDTTNGQTPIGALSGQNPQFPYVVVSNASNTPANSAFNGQGVNYTAQATPVTKIHQYNIALEQQIGNNMSASLAYVGSRAVNLNFVRDINQVPAGNLGLGDNQFRPYAAAGFANTINGSTYNADSNYNSLQATLQKRLTKAFSFDVNYVWSKFLDEFDSSAWGSRNGTTTYQSSYDIGSNYGPSNFDVRNAFKGDLIYLLPFGHGQYFFNKNNIVDELIGGWQLATTFDLQSGNPLTVTVPSNLAQSYAGSGNLYPNWAGNPNNVQNRSRAHWFNTTYIGQNGVQSGPDSTAAYSIPQNGTFGNFHRNNVYGPGFSSFDASLSKTFNLYADRFRMQIRADASNALNHPVFGNPNTSVSDGNFGKITSTNRYIGGRNIQLGARFSF